MSKKLTFLFVAAFIIVLSLFSSYIVVRRVSGAVGFGSDINMGGGQIKELLNTFYLPPPPVGLFHPVVMNYMLRYDEICFVADTALRGGEPFCVTNWCDINDFSWCADNFYGGPGCFTPETPILMADGSYKPIKEVKEEDRVLTKESENSDKMVSAKVTKTFEHTVDGYLIINNELKVTDIHPIFVDNKWKQAKAIKLGDKLLNEKGQEVVVESLEIKRETTEVYNLEIEGHATYFAGGVYVHNKPADGPDPIM